MQSSQFTLIPPQIKLGDLFPAIETAIPQRAIAEAITETNSQEKRKRVLPTHLMITLVIALNFWSSDSIIDVFCDQSVKECY